MAIKTKIPSYDILERGWNEGNYHTWHIPLPKNLSFHNKPGRLKINFRRSGCEMWRQWERDKWTFPPISLYPTENERPWKLFETSLTEYPPFMMRQFLQGGNTHALNQLWEKYSSRSFNLWMTNCWHICMHFFKYNCVLLVWLIFVQSMLDCVLFVLCAQRPQQRHFLFDLPAIKSTHQCSKSHHIRASGVWTHGYPC